MPSWAVPRGKRLTIVAALPATWQFRVPGQHKRERSALLSAQDPNMKHMTIPFLSCQIRGKVRTHVMPDSWWGLFPAIVNGITEQYEARGIFRMGQHLAKAGA